ncbi:DUF4132 domain-containing protein [Spirosoma sp. SC4-14]|uniref:DUF4132 domain-containing protein n=2 Tax=Spirosoma sp. SC4-14 TaxID=3128900 RepID=UPI0030CB822B
MSLINKLSSLFTKSDDKSTIVQPILDQFKHINTLDWKARTEQKKELTDSIKAKDAQFKYDFTYTLIRDYDFGKLTSVWEISELLTALHRSTVVQSEQEFIDLLTVIHKALQQGRANIGNIPILLILKQFQRFSTKQPLAPATTDYLRQLLNTNEFTTVPDYLTKDADKIKMALQELVYQGTGTGANPPVILDDSDHFGLIINQIVQQTTAAQRNILYGLLAHCKKASGAKPSGKFIDEACKLYIQLGEPATYINIAKHWLDGFKQTETRTETHTSTYNNTEYTYTTNTFLHELNTIIAKGIVWSLTNLTEHDPELVKLMGTIAEKSYQKIPGQGPAAASVGNACLYVLAQSGIAGVGQLSRLKLRIKQASTQDLIEKYIQNVSAQLGVSPDEIEDMAVSDYGLVDGTLTKSFGDYKAMITIVGVGKIDIQWQKTGGTPLKSEPAAVKKDFTAELKALKSTVADIAKNTTAQRNRLDRSLILNRRWTWSQFKTYYAEHGLMSFLTRQLIWIAEKDGQSVDMVYQNGTWTDQQGAEIDGLDTNTTIRLWHPVGQSVENVLAWRDFFTSKEIRQPLKQAFREVYLLTEAELKTRMYSNRMAAHILKQHQFNTLAKGRGWRYSLLGAYDKGYESEKAVIDLPAYDLKAEFWVSEVYADGAWNDTGIYLYVSTDQVRFTRPNNNDPLSLIDIPPLVFSEIMRDVDLFVGVASVGNDPNWRDEGLAQYRTYWESYSFGDLGELAKTRKQAVERLLPRLKIARVATVRDKFLVVRGKLRTYKIHLGSGNILMEPNDQYLCIVPDRSSDKATTNVFLPFEGDTMLSIILSKAFLLADDDKITDPSITWQIGKP